MSEVRPVMRCAIYTRKSTEDGLAQNFNSLQAQREAAEAYIRSQGWTAAEETFEDGGYSGGNLERPALQRLLGQVRTRTVECVVVYKVDRLSRSLLDFARLMAVFEHYGVSFVSVTQEFNTTSSLGRLTLNILLSFASFERDLISERTRDKLGAARRKGKWIGGIPILGYDVAAGGGQLEVNAREAEQVREIFGIAAGSESLEAIWREVERRGLHTKEWTSRGGRQHAGKPFSKGGLRALLGNVLYIGSIRHKGRIYPGEQEGIVEREQWEEVKRKLEADGGPPAGRQHRRQSLLRGILYCGQCGRAMVVRATTRRGRRYEYYRCAQKGRCREVAVAVEALDAAIGEEVCSRLSHTGGAQEMCRELRRANYDSGTRQVEIETQDGKRWAFALAEEKLGDEQGERGRIPRVSRLMALAIKVERLVAGGQMRNLAEVAKVGAISRARLSQIMDLRNLSPSIQERLLWLPKTVRGGDGITEKSVRGLARVIDWEEQERRFAALVAGEAMRRAIT